MESKVHLYVKNPNKLHELALLKTLPQCRWLFETMSASLQATCQVTMAAFWLCPLLSPFARATVCLSCCLA